MTIVSSKIIVRKATMHDAEDLSKLLNEIIKIGGTTAFEIPLSVQEFSKYFLIVKDHISCYVAVDNLDKIAEFQSPEFNSKLPDNWADIATFANHQTKPPTIRDN